METSLNIPTKKTMSIESIISVAGKFIKEIGFPIVIVIVLFWYFLIPDHQNNQKLVENLNESIPVVTEALKSLSDTQGIIANVIKEQNNNEELMLNNQKAILELLKDYHRHDKIN